MTYDIELNSIDDIEVWKVKDHTANTRDFRSFFLWKEHTFRFLYYGFRNLDFI